MLVGTPLVKAEQDCSIRIEDLTKVVMGGFCLRQAKQRLVPLAAARHIVDANDRPHAPHGALPAAQRFLRSNTYALESRPIYGFLHKTGPLRFVDDLREHALSVRRSALRQ
jgi:hypothetical protein